MATRYYVFGTLLVVLGCVGFLAVDRVAGVLDVTTPLNAIHVGAGLLTIAAATRGLGTMRAWGKLLGFFFAALAVAAAAFDAVNVSNVLPLTNSNAWWHTVVALFFLYHALLAPPTV